MRPLRLAVIGDPIAHSRSPELHAGFLARAGIPGSYEAIRVRAGDGAAAIARLRAEGYAGLNVTTPLKEEAFACADALDAAARASGAVNTLLLSAASVRGCNTDGAGALGALARAGLAAVAGVRVLVLGAGPTARAVVRALVDAGATVAVWNRTADRASRVAAALGAAPFAGGASDAVVSTLPPHASLDAGALAALAASPVVLDANYGPRATLATAIGRCDVVDGFAMLEAGAAASFALFAARVSRRALPP